MSTRAHIIIKDGSQSAVLYKHFDGYPGRTLPILVNGIMKSSNFESVVKTVADEIEQRSNVVEVWSNIVNDFSLLHSKKYPLHDDLEFLYIVDISRKNIDIYGGFGDDIELYEIGKYERYIEAERYGGEAPIPAAYRECWNYGITINGKIK